MGQPYVGEIRIFAGNFAPNGWMFCAGQLLPISEYETLYNLIGTTYGGDGQQTFALPDLQGRIPVHQGSGYVMGQKAGSETITLLASQIPTHNHGAQASVNGGTSDNPVNNFWANWTGSQYSDQASDSQMNAGALATTGGSQPHDNLMPYLALNFIISLFGVYPSQS